jgi:hypothetical protein
MGIIHSRASKKLAHAQTKLVKAETKQLSRGVPAVAKPSSIATMKALKLMRDNKKAGGDPMSLDEAVAAVTSVSE